MPAVYNIKFGDAPAGAVYCGRGTKYGNPFVMGYMWRGKRMTRDVVCDRFKTEVLPHLNVEELRDRDLLCHCKPFRCHCDDILEKANGPTCSEVQEESEAQDRRKGGSPFLEGVKRQENGGKAKGEAR